MSQLNDRAIALRRIEFEAILGHEGRERAPDAAEKRFGRRLREQESGFAVDDGFRQPAGLVADRQRSEFLRVHLAQAARLEARRHQRKIAAGKNPPRLAVVEADRDPDRIGPAAMRIDQRLLDLGLAAAGDDDLAAGLDDLVGGRQHEIDALLMNQAGDQAENRTARQRQAELLADVIGIGALAFPVAGAERLRQLRADPRIPAFVDAVQYPGQLRGVGAAAKQALEPAAEFGRGDLPGIGLADGGQMRGVDDAALEEGQLVVEFEAVDMEGIFRRADPAQRLLRETGPDRPDCGWSGWSGS